MAEQLDYNGRVALITGGGRGLGRAYALLLASRGATVVVNDLGGDMQGEGTDASPAQQVVQEIIDAGGKALANTDTVATPEGGQSMVEATLEAYGRIDILVHNAGNVRRSPLAQMTSETFDAVLDVHLRGGFHVLRPAFASMCEAGYGRVVMTGSINSLYGNADVVNYSVSKAGLVGLSNVAAIEGAEHGVKSNVILPGAVTRMAEGLDTSKYPPMEPELVAPMVAWLCHESCSVNGEIMIGIGGRMARAYAAETRGIYQPAWTIEEVGQRIEEIRDMTDPLHFAPAPDGHMEHLRYSFGMASGN
jgi:NAD(P)-dependent dehydrogenase (short-subunit alcohol dehydrogenase family)